VRRRGHADPHVRESAGLELAERQRLAVHASESAGTRFAAVSRFSRSSRDAPSLIERPSNPSHRPRVPRRVPRPIREPSASRLISSFRGFRAARSRASTGASR
jgi:hypothetical protein